LDANQHKTPEFLAMHPFGQVPVIVSVLLRAACPDTHRWTEGRRWLHPV
jgi:hypothetical protein